MRFKTSCVAALLALPLALGATPTRILTIDNGNQIVPDDWDAVFYYSLAPFFKNHLYFDTYSNGSSFGWAFLDVGLGTVVLWWNKPFEASALYAAAVANGASLGYSGTAFGVDLVQAWEPKEKRIKAPDNKLALGYALPVNESLNLGFCFRLANLDEESGAEQRDGAGAPLAYGPSLASLVNGSGGFYNPQNVWKYSNRQASNGLVLSPQFSFFGESFNVDAKLDLVWAGIDNSHSESLVSADGTGELSQTLKEKGTLSWQLKPRLRYMLDQSSSLMLKGYYNQVGINTEHRRKGSFSGSGFSAIQLQGFDHRDASQDVAVDQWEAFLGWLNTWDRGRSSVVLGAGAKGEQARVLAQTWQIRTAPATYDDLVHARVVNATVNKLEVPVVMGAELGVTPWAKVRGMVSRNWYSANETVVESKDYNGVGVIDSSAKSRTADDKNPAWVVAMGFGLTFGSFSWDTALNTGFTASPTGAAMQNPLYQSSFTYGF